MDVLSPQCAAQSVGAANQLFGLLIQTILSAQCSISPPSFWPDDYGEKLSTTGMLINMKETNFSFTVFNLIFQF